MLNTRKTRSILLCTCNECLVKLNSSQYLLLLLSTFKVLGGLVFRLFTLYSHFMVFFIFFCLHYTDPCKTPSMNVTLEFYQNSRQTKKTMKSLNYFWKQSMFTTLSWLSFTSLNLPEGRDTFQMIQKHPTQCKNFLENKGTFRTIWKSSRHSGKFPHNLEAFKTIWELSRQYGKCT